MRLEQWYLGDNDTTLDALDPMRYSVTGLIHGSPNFKDGTSVTTAPIRASYGKQILSMSGLGYELGTPAEHWIKQHYDAERPYNPANPLPSHSIQRLRNREELPFP